MKHYNNLASFYNGEDWAKCKAQVLNERLKDGIIYCEHCGEPILKSFNPQEKNNKAAMVFHHKEYLTAANVNNAAVSINPANIAILHWSCHNEVHERFQGGAAIPQKKVYLITGAPCSGKTSYVKERIGAADIVVDIDDIWETLSKQPRYVKPNGIKPIVFKMRDELEDLVRLRLGTWHNAFVIRSLPLAMDRQRMAERLGAEVITMDCTKEECIQRLLADPQGRSIADYTRYIEEYYKKYGLG